MKRILTSIGVLLLAGSTLMAENKKFEENFRDSTLRVDYIFGGGPSGIHVMHDALAGILYEHIILLANTDTYGGGGIYNSNRLLYRVIT